MFLKALIVAASAIALTVGILVINASPKPETPQVIPTTVPIPTPVPVTRTAISGSLFFRGLEDARQLDAMRQSGDSRYESWKAELVSQLRVFVLASGTVVQVGRDIAPESPGTDHFIEASANGMQGYIAPYNLK